MITLLSTGPDWTQTAIRVILGTVFLAHGTRKLKGWIAGAGLTETLRTLPEFAGLPVPLVFVAVMSQFLGGVSLIVGLLARVAAIAICVTVLSAIAMLQWRFGLSMNWFGDNKGPAFECQLLAIGLAVVIIVRGSGALSLDRLFFLITQ
jgi:putative oxidoreductase